MGPNGEAQYAATDLTDAYRILYAHYRYSYVARGEKRPRPAETADPSDRIVTDFPCEREVGHDFDRIGVPMASITTTPSGTRRSPTTRSRSPTSWR